MTTPTTERAATGSGRTLPRLQLRYREEIEPAMQDEFRIKNVMQISSLVKIVVTMGVALIGDWSGGRTTAFTCGPAARNAMSRETVMAARSGATSWFGFLARRG